MPELTETQTAINAGITMGCPTELEPGRAYAFALPSGEIRIVDRTEDRYLSCPRRKRGTVSVHDAEAFIAYVNKHGDHTTEIWRDTPNQGLVAVLNAHGDSADTTGFGDHRVKLVLRRTPSWQAWTDINGRLMTQTDFAEFIEANLIDIFDPPGAAMLELAESFSATTKVDFESTKLLASGQRALVWKESVDAKAGQRGQIVIPKELTLQLAPFYGGATFQIKARFRYRISDGGLAMGVTLDRPQAFIEAAFAAVVGQVAETAAAPVWSGVPSA